MTRSEAVWRELEQRALEDELRKLAQRIRLSQHITRTYDQTFTTPYTVDIKVKP